MMCVWGTNMTVLPILAVGILMKLVAALFVLVAIVLVLVILVQKGRGGGLSAAFGGGMAGGLLGSKTGDFLTWVTIVLVAVFLLLAVVMVSSLAITIKARLSSRIAKIIPMTDGFRLRLICTPPPSPGQNYKFPSPPSANLPRTAAASAANSGAVKINGSA